MKSSFLFFVALSTTLFDAQAQPTGEKAYRVSLPGTSKTCLEEAESLSNRFQFVTGITAVRAECSATETRIVQRQAYTFYSLSLFYPANAQLSIDKTKFGHYAGGIPGGINSAGDYYGAYGSYSSCLEDISFRQNEFEKYTGLKAISSYCSKGRIGDSFVLNIDSFGQRKMKLFTFDAGKWSKGDEILRYLHKRNAAIVHKKGSRFYYYANKSLNLGQHRLLSYQDESICKDQLENAKSIVRAHDSDSAMVRCVEGTQAASADFHLVALFSGENFFKTRYMSERYNSYEQCLADISRVIDEHVNT